MKKFIIKQVSVNLTARNWELYNGKGAENAAQKLNRKFEELVAAGKDRYEIRKEMGSLMHKLSKYGACDSEPIYKLELLLDKVFGEE